MKRREFTGKTVAGVSWLVFAAAQCGRGHGSTRPNILLITADDMNWDTPGCYGGLTPDVTPNIDRLAGEGVRFEHAHMTIAVCQPSRSVLMTGMYPHRNGAEGFDPINETVPTLQEHLNAAVYLNGILGKTGHLKPEHKFKWDMSHDGIELGFGRSPHRYYAYSRDFFDKAVQSGKPFFLMANSHDSHRPFHGSEQERRKKAFMENIETIDKPSRIYNPDEVDIPGFLHDLPDIRKELAQYYCSARRCDDTVGEVLRALSDSGQDANTLVMFISDNGMSFPYSKTNCYLNSTKTPWIVRWPGRIEPGTMDSRHMISGIDFMPTILEAAGLPQVKGMDGTSFLPLLFGGEQPERTEVFTQFHETSARIRYPMRCIQNIHYGYIFNPWADGTTVFKNESQSGLTFNAMKAMAQSDETIAGRVEFFLYRTREELYDFQSDPDALVNLVDDPRYKDQVAKIRADLEAWMEQTGDPALEAFRNRTNPLSVEAFMKQQQSLADSRKVKR